LKVKATILSFWTSNKINLNVYLKNSVWILAGQIASLIIGMVLSVFLARYSSKEIFGEFNYISSVFSLMLIFSIPGISSVVYRSLLEGKHGTYLLSIKKSIQFGFIGFFILLCLALYYMLLDDNGLALSFFLLAFVFPFFQAAQLWSNILNANEKFKEVNIYGTIVLIINLLSVIFVLLFLPKKIEYLVLAAFASVLFINIFFFFKTKICLKNDYIDATWFKSSIKLSVPALFSQFYAYIDKIVLMMFFGAEMLAIYSIAVIPAEKLNNFMGALSRLFLPGLYKAELRDLKSYFFKALIYFVLLSVLFLFVFYWIIEFLIEWLYTNSYSDAVFPAQVYLLIIPFYLLTVFSGNVLIKERRESFFSISVIISSLVNIIAYFSLIPSYGIMGGVIGSVLYYFVQSMLRIYYIFKYL
jgi:O-antigen/teichoic acid export membrane protein